MRGEFPCDANSRASLHQPTKNTAAKRQPAVVRQEVQAAWFWCNFAPRSWIGKTPPFNSSPRWQTHLPLTMALGEKEGKQSAP